MTTERTSQDVLRTLTPHEIEVLSERFGTQVLPGDPTSSPGSDDSEGSGGVPAPANPPS